MKGGSFIIPVLFILSLLNISMVSADNQTGLGNNPQLQDYLLEFKNIIMEEICMKFEDQQSYMTDNFTHLENVLMEKLDQQNQNFATFTDQINEKLDEILDKLCNKTTNIETILNKIDQDIQNLTNNQICAVIEDNSTIVDCYDLFQGGKTESGVYSIYPQGQELNVYCDMTTDGGGWTVFVKRQQQDPQLNFMRNWEDYKNGFGSPSGEYWLGNEVLHLMTSVKNYTYRMDAVGGATPMNNWEKYSTFQVDSESQKYQLTVDGYDPNSTTEESFGFGYNNGQKFSTFDDDNDARSGNCAIKKGGGFWFYFCTGINPTAPTAYFYRWSKENLFSVDPSFIEMKFRPTV